MRAVARFASARQERGYERQGSTEATSRWQNAFRKIKRANMSAAAVSWSCCAPFPHHSTLIHHPHPPPSFTTLIHHRHSPPSSTTLIHHPVTICHRQGSMGAQMLLDNIKNGGEGDMANDFPAFLMQRTQSASGRARMQRASSHNDMRRTQSDNRRSSFVGEVNGSSSRGSPERGRSTSPPSTPSSIRKLAGALGLASPASDGTLTPRGRHSKSDHSIFGSPSSPPSSQKKLERRGSGSFREDGLPPDSPILNLVS